MSEVTAGWGENVRFAARWGENHLTRYAMWRRDDWCVIARERVSHMGDIPAISVQFQSPSTKSRYVPPPAPKVRARELELT